MATINPAVINQPWMKAWDRAMWGMASDCLEGEPRKEDLFIQNDFHKNHL